MINDNDLSRVAQLVEQSIDQQKEVEALKAALSEAQRALLETEERLLPEALVEVGYMPGTKTIISGHPVAFAERFRCGQLDDQPDDGKRRPLQDRLVGLDWLDDNEHADLAKRTVTIILGNSSKDTQEHLIEYIRHHPAANSFSIKALRMIHAQTLSAFSREQYEAGEDIPLDKLGVSVLRTAKVTE